MKELVTGKCKEDFEKWYTREWKENNELPSMDYFNTKTPFEMQSGVFLAFFDSVGMSINAQNVFWRGEHLYWGYLITDGHEMEDGFKSRTEALTEAIKQANKIYNNK